MADGNVVGRTFQMWFTVFIFKEKPPFFSTRHLVHQLPRRQPFYPTPPFDLFQLPPFCRPQVQPIQKPGFWFLNTPDAQFRFWCYLLMQLYRHIE